MKQWMEVAALGVVLATMGTSVGAQERIYRCGNEYTNKDEVAKQGHCKPINGGHVTIVHSTPAPAAGKAAPSASASSPTPHTQVAPAQQKARDRDARAILQAELSKAQQKLQALQAQWRGGAPEKTPQELDNPQLWQQRVDALKADIARQEADIASIERELARHSGG